GGAYHRPSPMMTTRALAVLVGSGCCCAFVGAYRWQRALAAPSESSAEQTRSSKAARPVVNDDSLTAAAEMLSSNDPFRLSNAPADARYDPATDGVAPSAPMPVVRPNLILK